MLRRIEQAIKDTPEVAGFARRTGAELGLFATAQDTGDIVVRLKPRSRHSRNSEAIIEDLRERFAAEMPGMLAVAVLLVFGVLVAQFRFTSAFTILSTAPLSLVGAFGLLLITGTPLNVSSFMGLILLVGLIVKNGISLADYAPSSSRIGSRHWSRPGRFGADRS